ncbi:MAG: phage virion morphogenesis protein [Candidatus Contendobacter sp.]|jgi:phage virion morphogenesis protein|nr:phage virion morphogenesis protein [Candidatus Contendobacter sp.]
MAGTSQPITLEIENAAEVKAAFQELQSRLADLTPAFRDIGEAMLNSTRARFRSQTAPDGSPWAALSPDYQARKKKNADKILTLSGDLARLLNYQAAPREVRIGTPLIYGTAHQFGRPEINLPARPFLGLSKEDEQELLDILNEYLDGAL